MADDDDASILLERQDEKSYEPHQGQKYLYLCTPVVSTYVSMPPPMHLSLSCVHILYLTLCVPPCSIWKDKSQYIKIHTVNNANKQIFEKSITIWESET